jgi:pyruvate,water dikinase
MTRYVSPLQEIGEDPSAVQRCGGKAVGLGKLLRMGARVPPGFCVVNEALSYLMDANSLGGRIASVAASLNFEDYQGVAEKTAEIRSLITAAAIPEDLAQEILAAYRALVETDGQFVAVRSSVAVKNSEVSSFPGMMDTYHYVLGDEEVMEKLRECWASLWSARGAFARFQKRIPLEHGIIAPVVQLMVNSEVAGVMFTANPISQHTGEIVIEANWGLGESVVSGKSMNDFFVLDKETGAIKQKKIAQKTIMVTRDDQQRSGRKETPVPGHRAGIPVLSDKQLIELGEAGKRIERHFGYPADIEWAYEGETLYILQARKVRSLKA